MSEDFGQLRMILNILPERTREGKVQWEWNELDQAVTAALENGRVLVSKDRDLDTVIEVRDAEGITLEKVNTGYPKYRDLLDAAEEVYETARRAAFRVDSKLEAIIQEIAN